MQIAAKRDHRDHVKVTQVVEQAMKLVDRHSLVKQHLVGLGIDHVRTVKGRPEAKMSLMPDSCAASSFSRVRGLITFWSLVSVPSISIAMALIAIYASLR